MILMKEVGERVARAIIARQDFHVNVLMWSMEGRNLLMCGCGRVYKKEKWSLKHLFKLGHSPVERDRK